MKINSGVYKILNIKNNNFYIGSSTNLKRREAEHFLKLRNNKHENSYLQNAVNKHGIDNFKFEILAKCPPEYCVKLEQWFIDNQNPKYNIQLTARSKFAVCYPKKLTKNTVIKIINLLNSNIQIRDISKQLNVSESTIQDIKQGRTWKKYNNLVNVTNNFKGYEFGEKSKFSKLNENEVIEIINKINSDIPLNIICRDYNISPGQICSIRKGRNWKHLTYLIVNKGVKYKNSK